MNVRVTLLQLGQKAAVDYLLDKSIVLGRHAESDIVIDSDTASRHHGQLSVTDGHIWLKNVSDINPIHFEHHEKETILHAGESTRLHQGDKFTLGGITFEVEGFDGLESMHDSDMPRVICPHCGRSIPATYRECPYDGYSLAGAASTDIDSDLLDGAK